ncbi:MAG TPA: ATP-binding protein [Steroidobacteraceae bacterium]|nr:ATP-binding protein [Steroidobacteraceae bacterium]
MAVNFQTNPEPTALRAGAPEHPDDSAQRRERLLMASAKGSRLLLEAPDVMAAVPEVLRLIGEAAAVDRVNVILAEHGANGERLLRVASEWVGEGVAPQLHHPTMSVHAESEFALQCLQLRAGQTICIYKDVTPAELQDPGACCGFEGIGTKSKALVPIFVDGDFAGAVSFDNTRQRRAIDSTELATIETAAGVIGAALHRERLVDTVRRERERAAEARVAALATANAVIRGNLERLAGAPDLTSFMVSMLVEMTHELDAATGGVILLDDAAEQWRLLAYVQDGVSAAPAFGVSVACAETKFDSRLKSARSPIYLDLDLPEDAEMVWPGSLPSKRANGYVSMYVMPLVFGDRTVGCISLNFKRKNPISAQTGELLIALAQQATLAIEQTRRDNSEKAAAVLTERNRIGQEIHDGLAQAFTGILMQLNAVEDHKACGRGALRTTLDRIKDLARDGLAEARRSVMALRPDQTRRGGLGVALGQLAERSTIRGGVTVTYDGNGTATDLKPEHEHEIFRIAQEAVSNAVRHAKPSSVRIAFTEEPGHWRLDVRDDGCGMPREPSRHAESGFGLVSMRERANAIGGEWTIDSEWGAGTTVSVRVPKRTLA